MLLTTQLSDREFRVLHHLVEHQGEVISRERLLSEVWGYHFDPWIERRRRLHPPSAQEAWCRSADRDSSPCGLSAYCGVDWPEASWAAFAIANFAAMVLWPGWETIPFHFVWISLTLLYGFRVWRPAATYLTLAAVVTVTGSLILSDAFSGDQLWGELFEVPLMSAMFLAMVWHARRRQDALAHRRASG